MSAQIWPGTLAYEHAACPDVGHPFSNRLSWVWKILAEEVAHSRRFLKFPKAPPRVRHVPVG